MGVWIKVVSVFLEGIRDGFGVLTFNFSISLLSSGISFWRIAQINSSSIESYA